MTMFAYVDNNIHTVNPLCTPRNTKADLMDQEMTLTVIANRDFDSLCECVRFSSLHKLFGQGMTRQAANHYIKNAPVGREYLRVLGLVG